MIINKGEISSSTSNIGKIFKNAEQMDYMSSSVKSSLSNAIKEFLEINYPSMDLAIKHIEEAGFSPIIDITEKVADDSAAYGAEDIDFDKVIYAKRVKGLGFFTGSHTHVLRVFYSEGTLTHVYAAIYPNF